ncbi:1 3-beta-glucanosyltransferase gel2 [Monascus purpureus]|uniref:1,3-beta-glucanosyltransferase n=1 Tax=Monascus purpureus TaxID=5098 RepID=A0A507QJR0_MONPU|nr:1 3-beta-glucanosyltransferase gel2 [Monascus purpureus]BDD62338.1 1 3-beta-glucanosyltransferase gel2 [Monascus purpureus]
MLPSFARLVAAACAFAATATAVVPVVVSGKDFVNTNTKDRFQIIGIDYQPGGSSGFDGKSDPLSNGTSCLRDAAIMQHLGVNTIRVYNLSPGLNHDECASIFNGAGIYMILDVNSPLTGGYLDRTDPASTYNPTYYNQVFGVIEAFKNYPNTLGFFAGNEVINEQSVRSVPSYIRAVQRDMKDYIAKNVNRSIPVGYSAADVRDILMDTVQYMSCELENSTSSRSDFFGLNSYSWCGDSSYTISGYDVLTEDFSNASLPVFFSEYGCNKVTPRIFTEVAALYGQDMTQAFSGGLVYEYSEEPNNYGLVQLNSNGSVTLLVDYYNLQKQYNKLDLSRLQSSNTSQTSVKPVECGSSLITSSDFLNAFNLPTRPTKVQDMIDNGLSNANTGKLVSVQSTSIPETVYDYYGNVVTGIKLQVLDTDKANTPGQSTPLSTGSPTSPGASSSTASATASPSASGASSSEKSAASEVSMSWFLGALSGAFVMVGVWL